LRPPGDLRRQRSLVTQAETAAIDRLRSDVEKLAAKLLLPGLRSGTAPTVTRCTNSYGWRRSCSPRAIRLGMPHAAPHVSRLTTEATMIKTHSPASDAGACCSGRLVMRRVATAMSGIVLVASTTLSVAQIVSPNGPQSQDSRTSAMGTRPDPAASSVNESYAPQAKEAKGNARGPTAGKGDKPEGSGGFSNGLYGTGAGSNK
jgi:hypothetical protein